MESLWSNCQITEISGAARTGLAQRTGPREARAPRFESQPGHRPGWRVWSPLGGTREATDRCSSLSSMSLALSFFLVLLSLKINK